MENKKLKDELLELSKDVKNFLAVDATAKIIPTLELSDDIELPYIFTAEAIHPGTYKGVDLEEQDIVRAKDTIFKTEGNFRNYEINKQHRSARKEGSTVDDLLGRVIASEYDYDRKALMLTCEILDRDTAFKIMHNLISFVSLSIKPQRVDRNNGRTIARDLEYQELSLVRAPGDPNAHIVKY